MMYSGDPLYPLKTARTLRSDAEIAQARANVSRYPAAKRTADSIITAASQWLEWADSDLRRLITEARVPRAFDVGASIGCPECGLTIHEKFGTYPWLVDLHKPFKLTCPVDGSVYPTNDFAAYLHSSQREGGKGLRWGWDTAIVDDGWGWLNPANGERYWFVAHWNHRMWLEHVAPGVGALGQAYLLTGDRQYAHKAAVMLHRIAEVYPAMDHERQSRYGLLAAARGWRYPGKVVNAIWETGLITYLAEAYDAIWETIDNNTALHALTAQKGPALRAFIEANLLEDAIEAYFAEKIRGNFGMHQKALATLALVRQRGDQETWLGGLLHRTGVSDSYTGLEYALYNLVYRDGMPGESAPGYNFIWTAELTRLAELLGRGHRDLFALPRTRSLYEAPLDIINIRCFTPSWGDSGSVYGEMQGRNPDVYRAAYRAYHDERYARFLACMGAAGDAGFNTFESLFHPPIPPARTALLPQSARLLDGCGLGILSDREDRVSATLTYGLKAGHGHFDRLSFELFAHGQALMPDLGYPDAMNDYVAGIYAWSKNTIAHNTVVVDAKRQRNNVPGTVRLFADSNFARTLDVEAAETYPQVATYRRALFQVDVGASGSYLLDVFTVAGGHQHDYALHGPPGQFQMLGGRWTAPAKGTLAGEDVSPGTLYDDPVLGKPGYQGGYSHYTGSGYQYLTDVQRGEGDEDWVAEWHHEKAPNVRLRIRILPQKGQQMLLAKARVSPVKFPQRLQFLIARKEGKEEKRSGFVSVIEPYQIEPHIRAVKALAFQSGNGNAVEVRRTDEEKDVLIYDPTQTEKHLAEGDIMTDAHAAIVTWDASGQLRRVFFAGGSFLRAGEEEYRAAPLAGVVTAVHPGDRKITVRLDPGSSHVALKGRIVHFTNALHCVAYTLVSARRSAGGFLTLTTKDDLLVGRAPITQVDGTTLHVGVGLPLGPTYRGAAACGPDFTGWHRVESAEERSVHLQAPLSLEGTPFQAGQDVWLVNVAPGDRVEAPALFTKEKRA